ncbi:MAG: hypothetical protein J0I41_00510 [Filimonas sp.]|nr:hypothetical protein [Filimonas sp.]
MKKIITLLLLSTPLLVRAQNTFPSTGNVGIGTATPSAPLEVNNNGQSYYVNKSISGSTEGYTGKAYLLLYSGSSSQLAGVSGKISAIKIENATNKYTWSAEVNSTKGIFEGFIMTAEKDIRLVHVSYNNVGYTAIEIPKELPLHLFSFTGYAQGVEMQVVSEQTVSNVTEVLPGPINIGRNLQIGSNMNGYGGGLYVKANASSLASSGEDLQSAADGIILAAGGNTTYGPALELATTNLGANNIAFPWGRSHIISTTNSVDDGTGRMILGTKRLMDIDGNGERWNYGDDIVIDGVGNVGIGTLKPSSKLAVNGIILAKRVRVSQSASDWPDYVFNKSYPLASLDSVEAFINDNKHLPGIPSATTVEKEGHDLGEMQKAMLQKIEELTLYVIELKKENTEIRKQLKKQKK